MVSSPSNLADNVAEGLHIDKCEDSKFWLKYGTVKDKLLIYKCLNGNKNYQKGLIKTEGYTEGFRRF